MKNDKQSVTNKNSFIDTLPSPHNSTCFRLAALCVSGLFIIACGSGNSAPPSSTPLPDNSMLIYSEDFTAPDGSALPAEWMPIGASTVNADIQNNSARLQTNSVGTVARVVSTTLNVTNFDAKITIRFEDYQNQGIGFYGRQNGGYLMATNPFGQGYVTFTEGFLNREIGIWEEINGVETLIVGDQDPLGFGNILNNTNYCVRFRVEQIDGLQTQIRTRIWLQSDPEPMTWNVELISSTPLLQNQSGGFALDLYNASGTGAIYFDDIEIVDLGP